jgi:hypothetical protein
MTFFTLANVLLNNLFARRRFGVVAGIVVLAVAYIATLQGLKPRLLQMDPALAYRTGVQILCGFTAAMLALTAAFVRFERAP